MSGLSVLVVGGGGREHALAWKLAQSPRVAELYVAPGNAGTAAIATNVPVESSYVEGLLIAAQEKAIDLTIVGPEAPLAAGIVDAFHAAGLRIFGPTQAAAQLETSKAFAKSFMQMHGIPTAVAETFSDYNAALAYVRAHPGAAVVKASGLAAGKGVLVCETTAQVETALRQMMIEEAFGEAGMEVVVEERLSGPEVSLLAFCDGQTAVPLLPARDYKRAYDNDQGPNTGGMGAYAPPAHVDRALVDGLMDEVIRPTVRGMAARGTPYVGVLYAGLMLTDAGPRVLEFNCRFGDPEAQVLLPLLESDLVEVVVACIEGRLAPEMVRLRDGACAAVVMAASGYPGNYAEGLPILGLEDAAQAGALIFHAGTEVVNGEPVTDGGRVLAVSALGPDVATAVAKAYAGVEKIDFKNAHYRTDIGR